MKRPSIPKYQTAPSNALSKASLPPRLSMSFSFFLLARLTFLYFILLTFTSRFTTRRSSTALILHTRQPNPLTGLGNGSTSSSLVRRPGAQAPRPMWHAPWKLMRVISGHLGWVRSVAVEPGNKWFVTGAGDRTIKVKIGL